MDGVRDDLIGRARGGDGEAFRALTEPHRRELQVHCYRMLGSLQDAEDALQDTYLSAWRGLRTFGERSSIRTWLYRIATNRCLDALRSAGRRPAKAWDVPGVEPPEPTRYGEVTWLEPYPDALLEEAAGVPLGPEARYEQTESISLAFVTALQLLPPRQLAVLVLRDVLGFPATEVAGMLDTTVDGVKSALKRARTGLRGSGGRGGAGAAGSGAGTAAGSGVGPGAGAAVGPVAGSADEGAIVARFVRAYEAADVPALVELFTDDVFMAMPPLPQEYEGREAVGAFCEILFGAGRRFDLVATRANGSPAFGAYLRAPSGDRIGTGLYTVSLTGDRIASLLRFERHLLPRFNLPTSLPPAH